MNAILDAISSLSLQQICIGRRPTPKDSYAITEAYMKEIPIPAPSDKKTVMQIIDMVNSLEKKPFSLTQKDDVREVEEKLQALVDEALAAVST